MKLERNLDGRHRRENSAKGYIAFLPADAPNVLRPTPVDQLWRIGASTHRTGFAANHLEYFQSKRLTLKPSTCTQKITERLG